MSSCPPGRVPAPSLPQARAARTVWCRAELPGCDYPSKQEALPGPTPPAGLEPAVAHGSLDALRHSSAPANELCLSRRCRCRAQPPSAAAAPFRRQPWRWGSWCVIVPVAPHGYARWFPCCSRPSGAQMLAGASYLLNTWGMRMVLRVDVK